VPAHWFMCIAGRARPGALSVWRRVPAVHCDLTAAIRSLCLVDLIMASTARRSPPRQHGAAGVIGGQSRSWPVGQPHRPGRLTFLHCLSTLPEHAARLLGNRRPTHLGARCLWRATVG
jgi:hypothetical protein